MLVDMTGRRAGGATGGAMVSGISGPNKTSVILGSRGRVEGRSIGDVSIGVGG